jgi:acid phosphatase type 7
VCSNNNDELTAQIIDTVPDATVIALGDNAFPSGSAESYNNCYGPTWGRFKARTWATLGNHDWDSTSASFAGAISYFGDRAGPPGKHYYSFDVGAWHIVVLNVVSGSTPPVPYNAGSEQQTWLSADLTANAGKKCTMVVWHDPRFMSSRDAPAFHERTTLRSLWGLLEAHGVDVVLNGNQHWYERMHPMRSDGARDDSLGIRQFIVGTGGESVIRPSVDHPNAAAIWNVYGVLRFTLRDGDYDWRFVPVRGAAADDAGSGRCH